MPYTIYATTVNDYDANTNDTWANTRGASKGNETLNPVNPRHSVSFNGVGWRFIRTYMEFDLSSVTEPITTMTLYVKGQVVTGNTSYIAYGGQSSLTNTGDYSLYLTELIGSYALTSGVITNTFTAFPLDLTQYPPNDPPGPYVIGLVADVDFNNSENSDFDQVRIENNVGIDVPYLVINAAGYPYEVNGVLGANITEVSGVSVANITNIMGV